MLVSTAALEENTGEKKRVFCLEFQAGYKCLCWVWECVVRVEIMKWKDACWQIVWPSIWATTLHAKASCPINYKQQASELSCTHCLVYPSWPVCTADILFWALKFVIGGGHTTHTLTRATLEPLSHMPTSTLNRVHLDNTYTVLTLKCSLWRWSVWQWERNGHL